VSAAGRSIGIGSARKVNSSLSCGTFRVKNVRVAKLAE
jgi:hypothetical protein